MGCEVEPDPAPSATLTYFDTPAEVLLNKDTRVQLPANDRYIFGITA